MAYSLPVGSGLIGSKEVEGLGRTELLSSEAEDCSGWVSNPAGWLAGADALLRGSKSLPLLLDSAAETPHSGKSHRHTQEHHLPPASKQAAAAQAQPSLAMLAKHRQLLRKKGRKLLASTHKSSQVLLQLCWRAVVVVPGHKPRMCSHSN